MCKLSYTDMFNFTCVCDYRHYHFKSTKTRQLVNTCGLIKRTHFKFDSNLIISSQNTVKSSCKLAARRWSVTFNFLSLLIMEM